MKAPTFDELVLLPEPLALQRHFDARNYRAFRFVLILVTLLCVAGIAESAQRSNSLGLAIYIADILAGAVLFAAMLPFQDEDPVGDLSGKTVMPAMINVHAHMGFEGYTTWQAHNHTPENLLDHLQREAFYGMAAATSVGSRASTVAPGGAPANST